MLFAITQSFSNMEINFSIAIESEKITDASRLYFNALLLRLCEPTKTFFESTIINFQCVLLKILEECFTSNPEFLS